MAQQIYHEAADPALDPLIDDTADHIDIYNLASMIVRAIADQYGTASLEQVRDFWYRAVRYSLPDLFAHIARWLPDPADEE